MLQPSPSCRRRPRLTWIAPALLAAAFLAASIAPAQDPVEVNPASVHLTLENARVRVLDARLAPGQKEQLHSHPACVIYVVDGGKVRNHTADGTVTELTIESGATLYREPTTHWAENIGKTTLHLVIVELEDAAKPGAAAAAGGNRR